MMVMTTVFLYNLNKYLDVSQTYEIRTSQSISRANIIACSPPAPRALQITSAGKAGQAF